MDVLIAGASGFLGLSVVDALARAGHRARGLVRSLPAERLVERARGVPVPGDLLLEPSLHAAMAGCDAVVHVATSRDPDHARRVRVEGAENLVRAARVMGVGRVVIGSGLWVHGAQSRTITEESKLAPLAAARFDLAAEHAAQEAGGDLEVLVVRPGRIYGPGSWFGEMAEAMQRNHHRIVGDGSNKWSLLHVHDAGEAFRVVLERGRAGEAYVAVDDTTVTARAFAQFVAHRMRAPEPGWMPLSQARRELGDEEALLLAANQEASNSKLRALHWAPRYPSYLEGVPEVLLELGIRVRTTPRRPVMVGS